MSGNDIDDLEDLLGPEPVSDEPDLVEAEVPAQRPSLGLLQRSRSYPMPSKARKNTPERLNRILRYATEMPVDADVCRRSDISITTLKYWLQKSSEGAPGDGFDIVLGDADETGNEDNSIRFHDAYAAAFTAGVERVEAATMQRASGYLEVLTHQGRVQYRYDPQKQAASRELGIPENVPANYLLDEYGAPVPETVLKMDPDLAMFILKARKPQIYGAKASVDVNVKGGVLVVGMRAATSEALNQIEDKYRKEGRPSVVFEEGDDDDDESAA